MVNVRFFENYGLLTDWLSTQEDFVLVAEDVPLLSNLNLLENVALIDEVHHHMSVKQAESKVLQTLKSNGLEQLAFKRIPQCNDHEIFQFLLLRAAAMPKKQAFILLPLTLVNHEDGINAILNIINNLKIDLTISILDLKSNQIHYQGLACLISE